MMRPHGSGVCAPWMPVVPMGLLRMRPGVKPVAHATRHHRWWCKARYRGDFPEEGPSAAEKRNLAFTARRGKSSQHGMLTADDIKEGVMTDTQNRAAMLSGCRVLDFTQYLAGPTVTRLMAEMGADIIKVEQSPGGDPTRNLPYLRDGRSVYFVQQNRGKRSVCLDFSRPESLEVIRDLARGADVV